MMIRSRTPSCSAGGIAGCAISSVVTAGPGVGKSLTGGTTRIVGAAFPARRWGDGRGGGSAGRVDRDLGQVRGESVRGVHQAGDPDQDVAGGDRLVEGQVAGGLERAVRGDGEVVDP